VKLLLDQNLSPRLLRSLEADFPGSSHVRLVGLEKADDETLWEFARQQSFTIVSKDADFRQRSFLLGFPPKVIWIRLGNCSTSQIEKLLNRHKSSILEFFEDESLSFLALS
jgi:predicted nuclease of predicted toxin-antitoxin system